MKIVPILILVAALIVTGYMVFMTKSMEAEIDTLSDKMITEQSVIDSYHETISKQQDELQLRRNQIDEINKELTSAEDHYYYTSHRGAFLTFDDTPNDNTNDILTLLRKENIKATFFVVGSQVNSEARETTLKMMANEGHAVGIHCYNDSYAEIYASEEAYFADLYKARDRIEAVTGITPNVVRFPGGTTNAQKYLNKVESGLFTKVVKRLKDEGFEIDDWTVDAGDSSSGVSVSDITNTISDNITSRIKSSNQYKTVVVLMRNKALTVKALPKIIALFEKYDFQFDTLKANHYCRTSVNLTKLIKEAEKNG